MSLKLFGFILFATFCNIQFTHENNVVVKWLLPDKLPSKENGFVTLFKNLSKSTLDSTTKCRWMKANRFIDYSDVSFVQGEFMDHCTLTLVNYDNETHDQLDYYKGFKISDLQETLPQSITEKDGTSDIIYALAIIDELVMEGNLTTNTTNEYNFKCYINLRLKMNHEFDNELQEKVQNAVFNQIDIALTEKITEPTKNNKKDALKTTGEHIKSFFNLVINKFSGKKTKRSVATQEFLKIITGDTKTFYMSDTNKLLDFNCKLRLFNDDGSVFMEKSGSIPVNYEIKSNSSRRNLHSINLVLHVIVAFISSLFFKF